MQETNYENKILTQEEVVVELQNKIRQLSTELYQTKRQLKMADDAVAKEEGKVEILKELLEDSIRKLIKQNE